MRNYLNLIVTFALHPVYSVFSFFCTKVKFICLVMHTHTHTTVLWLWILSGTSWVSRYQKKHSPTHTYHGHQSSLICFLHLLWSMASSLFSLRAWVFFRNIQVFFGLPLGLAPFTSNSIHFFTQDCLLFTAHAHTISTCCAVVPRLYHVILVS